jgi:hypothetical protein
VFCTTSHKIIIPLFFTLIENIFIKYINLQSDEFVTIQSAGAVLESLLSAVAAVGGGAPS